MRTVSRSAHDKKALGLIGQDLAGSDPHLGAMLSAFNRLTEGEVMPGHERIQASGQHMAGRPFDAALAAGPGSRRRMTVQRLIVLISLAPLIALITLALVTGHAGTVTNRTGTKAPCAIGIVHVCGNHPPVHRQSQPSGLRRARTPSAPGGPGGGGPGSPLR